jgi:hypothetical protein
MPDCAVPVYLCYKDSPKEFMLLKLVGTTPEAFEKYSLELAREHGVDPSSTPFERLDGMTRQQVEEMMRELGLITEENEREVLVDIGQLGLP